MAQMILESQMESQKVTRVSQIQQFNETSTLEEGINDLRIRSKKVCMHALAWHLLLDMEEQGIGTNEVEMQELRRSWQREAKKGYGGSLKQFEESGKHRRDEKYIKGILVLRAEQARQDWNDFKRDYREKKAKLLAGAREQGRSNESRGR